jgi:RNA polymerase sigma-70 factor (ECF subfamily)
VTTATPDVADLWRDLHARLAAFVRRRVPSAADAEDVVQDVFVRAHVGLGRTRGVDDVEAWMFRVARSAIVDWYRRRGRDVPDDLAGVADPVVDEGSGDEASEALSHCMRPFVDALSEPYREAVRLVDLEGLTHAEAAARAGVSVSGMKSRVQRGRAQLRGLLDACCRFEVDRRGRVTDFESKACGCGSGEPESSGGRRC